MTSSTAQCLPRLYVCQASHCLDGFALAVQGLEKYRYAGRDLEECRTILFDGYCTQYELSRVFTTCKTYLWMIHLGLNLGWCSYDSQGLYFTSFGFPQALVDVGK